MAAYVAHNTTFNTTAGTKSNAPTPSVGVLIVVIAAHTGLATAASVTDNQGGTYTEVAFALKNGGADRLGVWIRTALVSSAVAHSVQTSAVGSTGGGLVTIQISGMTKVGLAAMLKSAKQDNQAAGGTPAPVLASAALTGNLLIGAVFNATNTATLTPPSGWTEEATGSDLGYATPTTGLEWAHKDSGFTGTTVTWGSTSASAFCSVVVELDTSAGGMSAALGTVIETDSAQPVGRAKAKAVVIATDTQAAVALPRAKRKAVAAASEADTVPAVLGRAKARLLGIASEADQAVHIAHAPFVKALGTASEADSALVLGRAKRRAAATASEADSSQPLGRRKVRAVGISSEADTALVLARRKLRAVLTASEADTAPALTHAKRKALGVSSEADTALALARAKRRALAIAAEADTGQPFGRRKAKALGLATSTEVAVAIIGSTAGGGHVVALGTATTSDTAGSLGRRKARAVGTAVETDGTGVIGGRRARPIQPAVESDTALPLTRQHTRAIGTASELATALTLGRSKAALLGVAVTIDTAGALEIVGVYVHHTGGQLAVGGQRGVAEVRPRVGSPEPTRGVTVQPGRTLKVGT